MTTIDHLGRDVLQNILARLPSIDFASANCVSRSWKHVCSDVLCRPKLSSACSFNFSLQVAVEDVVNKVLSEPIRPHFAIASICNSPDDYFDDYLEEAHELLTTKLGSKVPLITVNGYGIIGRDAISDEFQETQEELHEDNLIRDERGRTKGGIMLTVGYVPGMKVKPISLIHQIRDPHAFLIDEFITDIREFSTSTSGRESPSAIMMFMSILKEHQEDEMIDVMGKLDHVMSPETVIVGGYGHMLKNTNESSRNITASEEHAVVALVFAMDKNKPLGFGETKFHGVVSSVLLPVGPSYKVTSIERNLFKLTARREGSHENLDGDSILRQACENLGGMVSSLPLYIGVTRRRKCSIGNEKVGLMTYLAFHAVTRCSIVEETLFIDYMGIKKGDTLRFYHPDATTALSSVANASNHMRSLKKGNISGDKQEVFGGFIFTSFSRGEPLFGQPNVESSPFLDNYPSVTLGGLFSGWVFGRADLNMYATEFQEQKTVRSFMHECGAVFLTMSYTR